MHSLRNELKRGFLSPYFYLGLLVCLSIYALGQSYSTWRSIFHGQVFEWVHQHNMFMIEFNPYRTLLPLAATLPY